jgi:uncharacterized protein YutE (UPF0331/DUF86 family)
VVRPEVAAAKIARAGDRLRDAEGLISRPVDDFSNDAAARDLAAFYLFLAAQECIDLAAHWIADAGWPAPRDVGSMFDALADRGAIDRTLADEMRGVVRVRNRIGHGYASVDHERLHAEAPSGIAAMRRFLVAVSAAAGLR